MPVAPLFAHLSPSRIVLSLQFTFQIWIHLLHDLLLRVLVFAFGLRNAMVQQLISVSQRFDTLVVPDICFIAPRFTGFFTPSQFPTVLVVSSWNLAFSGY